MRCSEWSSKQGQEIYCRAAVLPLAGLRLTSARYHERPGLGIARASGYSLGGPFQGGKIASRERRRERAQGSASPSGQQSTDEGTGVVATRKHPGDGDLRDGDTHGVCDGLDRVNEGKVSVKVLSFGSADARKSPCAPISRDPWR